MMGYAVTNGKLGCMNIAEVESRHFAQDDITAVWLQESTERLLSDLVVIDSTTNGL